jgi:hypothetical protein
MYPADVCAELERAGLKILVSAPSKSEALPICEQKRDLILLVQKKCPGARGHQNNAIMGRAVIGSTANSRSSLDRR